MAAHPPVPAATANLGIFDGEVRHDEVNHTLAGAEKHILYGEQTRLPFFPDDDRLPKLHSGDRLVLLFWRVFGKVPVALREALLAVPFSLTLVRGGAFLFYGDSRRHQALHLGCRRRTIYVPEGLLLAAEERGYDYWAIAEGLIHAAWMLLDYLLLVDMIAAYAAQVAALPGLRFNEPLQVRLVRAHNRHRRDAVDDRRSEAVEFALGYRTRLLGLPPAQAAAGEPHALARRLFDTDTEMRWAQGKTERLAQAFNFPRMFLFDRDIIHGAARAEAERRGEDLAPADFTAALHDYRDALRFDPHPPLDALGRARVPRPRALFLRQLVALGGPGLRGFLAAYRDGQAEANALIHALWAYLCSLSSDPAGVFARVGRLRAVLRQGLDDDLEPLLAGVLIRLDLAPNYGELVAQVAAAGPSARSELETLVNRQRLVEEDDWEAFKGRKQGVVTRAAEVLAQWDGNPTAFATAAVAELHSDPAVQEVLAASPHRLTSDPSGALMYLQAYRRSAADFGPMDPDSRFLLASLLIRLDRSDHYPHFLQLLAGAGEAAVSAFHGVFEQIPERDSRRRDILRQARLLWARMAARPRPAVAKGGA